MTAATKSARQRKGVAPHPWASVIPGDPGAKQRMGHRLAGMAVVGGAPRRRPAVLGGGALLLLALILAAHGGGGGGGLRIKVLSGGGWKIVDTWAGEGAEAMAGAAGEEPQPEAEPLEGDFPEGCVWGCYLANYADLEEGLPHTEEAALQHYLKNGIKEERDCLCIFPPECSARCYMANHPDLHESLPQTEKAALDHFLKTGMKEGRDCQCKNERAVGCVDDPKWQRRDDNPDHDCGFVAQLPENRCFWVGEDGRLASQACRKACGSCGCVDDVKWTRRDDDPSHDCSSVAKLPERRCAWQGEDGRPASQACGEACGSCLSPAMVKKIKQL